MQILTALIHLVRPVPNCFAARNVKVDSKEKSGPWEGTVHIQSNARAEAKRARLHHGRKAVAEGHMCPFTSWCLQTPCQWRPCSHLQGVLSHATLTLQEEDEEFAEIPIARSRQALIQPLRVFAARSAWVDSKEKSGHLQLVQGPVRILRCAQAGIRMHHGRAKRLHISNHRVVSCQQVVSRQRQLHGALPFLVRRRLSTVLTAGEVARQQAQAQMTRN